MVTEIERPKRKHGTVTATEMRYHETMPDSAYDMWVRGDLNEFLSLPPETRVEVIEGDIVVSPSAVVAHAVIVEDIAEGLRAGRGDRSSSPWRAIQVVGFDLVRERNGVIPDLLLVDRAALAQRSESTKVFPEDVVMVVEVTSKSNARNDREPFLGEHPHNKWYAYARAGVRYYFVVDRDPRIARSTLYGEPDGNTGSYATLATWSFGDEITLPEPLGFTIDASEWKPWEG
jgi:Uma2 family endonuclease